MPCRAAPPPPPPPHSTRELTPTPPTLSNPLVYRLQTCCLQEFLPRVSIVQRSSISTGTAPSAPSSHSAIDHTTRPSSPHLTRSIGHRHRSRRSKTTQLSALFSGTSSASNDTSGSSSISSNNSSISSRTAALSAALVGWQSPSSNIPLAQLQSTLAHRFLRWAVSEDLIKDPLHRQQQQQQQQPDCRDEDANKLALAELEEVQEHLQQTLDQPSNIDIEQTHPAAEQTQMTSMAAAGQDWAAAHDLVWADGDYYMAKKIFILEGVAHLRRGRRYIFVEPILGPASPYLYPRWSSDDAQGVDADGYEDSSNDEGFYQQQQQQHYQHQHEQHGVGGSGNDVMVASAMAAVGSSSSHSTSVTSEHELDKDQDDEAMQEQWNEPRSPVAAATSFEDDNERDETENDKEAEDQGEFAQYDDETNGDLARVAGGLADKGALPYEGERTGKDETDSRGDNASSATTTTSSTANAPSTATTSGDSSSPLPAVTNDANLGNTSNASSSFEDDAFLSHEFLEPYSPLLDPSTDAQDQFEYGLYELQYIPKIQHLLPQQFLPTRQSFIVHLDEDRPTLASPVPAHSKRSECRCQLMMRKVLLHRDLLQVWPPIPPVRTLLERQQEAEEEARMMELKQKVQMQTKNWRETLQTQAVACG